MEESTRKAQIAITEAGDNEKWTPFNELAVCGLSPFEDEVYFWFNRLSSERPSAEGGVREIPYSKIEDRLERLGLTGTPEGEDVAELLCRLDREYCEFWAKRFREIHDKHKPGRRSLDADA